MDGLSDAYDEDYGRGFEKAFYTKFNYLPESTHGGNIQMGKDMQLIYDNQDFKQKQEKLSTGLDVKAKLEENTYFTIDDQEYTSRGVFNLDTVQHLLSEGWPGEIQKYEFEWSKTKNTICRDSIGKVVQKLEEQRMEGFLQSRGCKSILLNGEKGSGKSMALAHIVAYARNEGWLTLYVPNAYDLVSNYRIKPSETRKWIYDLHEGAVVLLENFRNSHKDKLENIKMRGKLPKIKALQAFNDSRTKNTTLLDLIEFGITCDNPSEVFIALRAELDSVTEYPVLIAVDDINALFGNSGFMKPLYFTEQKIVYADCSEISVLRALNQPENSSLINGTMVAAISSSKPKYAFIKHLGEEKISELSLTIPPYTYDEYLARINTYLQDEDLYHSPSVISLQYIYQICCGSPKHVARYYATLL